MVDSFLLSVAIALRLNYQVQRCSDSESSEPNHRMELRNQWWVVKELTIVIGCADQAPAPSTLAHKGTYRGRYLVLLE